MAGGGASEPALVTTLMYIFSPRVEDKEEKKDREEKNEVEEWSARIVGRYAGVDA